MQVSRHRCCSVWEVSALCWAEKCQLKGHLAEEK